MCHLVCGEVLQTPHAAGHLPTQSHCKGLASHRPAEVTVTVTATPCSPHGQVGEVGWKLMQHHLVQSIDGVVVFEGASGEPNHSFKWVPWRWVIEGVKKNMFTKAYFMRCSLAVL